MGKQLPLTLEERLSLIEEVTLQKNSISAACKKFKVSRQTFYKWKRRYDKAPADRKKEALKDQTVSGHHHWKAAAPEIETLIINLITDNPKLSTIKIVQTLPKTTEGKFIIGNHGVQNILERLNLNTYEKRASFSLAHSLRKIPQITKGEATITEKPEEAFLPQAPTLAPPAWDAKTRLLAIEQVVRNGSPISKVCKDFNISRQTFYKWKKIYDQTALVDKQSALENRPVKQGQSHWKTTPYEIEQLIISRIKKHPEYSVIKLSQTLPTDEAGKPIIGRHGIQKVLERYGLNTLEKRLEYSKINTIPAVSFPQPETVTQPSFVPETPTFQPLPVFEKERQHFSIKFLIKYVVLSALSSPLNFIAVIAGTLGTLLISSMYIKMLVVAQPGSQFGLLLASIALVFGLFFFLYSMKYYLTIALVLGFSKQLPENGKNGNGNGYKNNNNNFILSKIFKDTNNNGSSIKTLLTKILGNRKSNANPVPSTILDTKGIGLISNLESISLDNHPFVSIHLATYNEKRVIDRLLTAATTQDYDNYEVVVVDDSTDETVDILNRWANHPKVKVIHRPDRSGFKGGALKVALENTSPQSEFIIVFDADFIPYPDTITQFLKYFKAATGKLSSFQDYKESNIAAIQGYQWHVLNKSENWLTRGVRSEFAGSYVMERSGNEVLGGLKQIAGSVYMIRRDVLQSFGWGTSITEDFELTLKIYQAGYKVIYTPYIQAPSECVSTVKRLIRQRMRWAEGHTHNVRKMFGNLLTSPHMTRNEKMEFFYLSPYYLQSAFFMVGTLAWFLSETVLKAKLPFWTSLWGWSLVFSNLLSLPLMNSVGLFLEESEEKDYLGILSFVAMSYLLVPFQAYASIKGLIEKEEGPWFRTPKTGKITDTLTRGHFYRWINILFPWKIKGVMKSESSQSQIALNNYLALSSSNSRFNNFKIARRPKLNDPISLLILGMTSFSMILFYISVQRIQVSKLTSFSVIYGSLILRSLLLTILVAGLLWFFAKKLRKRLLTKPVLASLLVIILLINYFTFFTFPPFQKLTNLIPGKTLLSGNTGKSTVYAAEPKVDEVPLEDTNETDREFKFISQLTDEVSFGVLDKETNSLKISAENSQKGVKIKIGLPDTSNSSPKRIEGGSATFEYKGNEITWTSQKQQIIQKIILKDKPGTNVIQFDIEGDGLLFEKQTDGTYLVRKENTGEVIFKIGKPEIEGKEETPDFEIKDKKIKITISQKFLDGASYPVTLTQKILSVVDSLNLNQPQTLEGGDFKYKSKLLHNIGIVELQDKEKDEVGYKITTIKEPKRSLKFSWKGLKASEKTQAVKGEKLEYDLDSITKVKYQVLENGVKEDIILSQKPPAGTLFQFDYVTEGEMSLINLQSDGSYVFEDPKTAGLTYFKILPPTITDANGQKGTIKLNFDEEKHTATFDIDQNFLNTATYPVTIDPTSIATVNPEGTQLVQVIDIIKSAYTGSGTGYTPSGTGCYSEGECQNILGEFKWTSGSYTGATVYFEAVLKSNSSWPYTGYASLFTEGGVEVSGAAVSTENTTYARLRSGSITLTNATNYSVRVKSTDYSTSATVSSARVIVVQSSTSITNTETNFAFGPKTDTGSATYISLTDSTIFYFDSSKYDTLTAYFQATLRWYTDAGTTYAQLYNVTDSEAVTGSEISTTSGSYVLVRSNALTIGTSAGNLKTGKQYIVQIKVAGSYSRTASLSTAYITLVQSNGGSALTKIRTYQQFRYDTSTGTSYAREDLTLRFDPTEWSNITNTYYFEAAIKTSANTGYAKLKDETNSTDITNSEISTTSTSTTRVTSSTLSGFPSTNGSAIEFDLEDKVSSAATVTISYAWLIIDISIGGLTDAYKFRGERTLLRDSSGNYYAIYVDGSNDINVKKSTDKGATWGSATTQTEDVQNLSADIDSSNNLHIATQTTGGNIVYYKFTTSTSTYSSSISLSGTGDAYRPYLVIDANDLPSVSWSTPMDVRFSHASADPTTQSNWTSGNGTVDTASTKKITLQNELLNQAYSVGGGASGGYTPSGTGCYEVSDCQNILGEFRYVSANYTSPTIYFEAVITVQSGYTGYAALFTEGGAQVTNSNVSTTSTSYTRVRSGSITLTNATNYNTRIKSSESYTSVYIRAARLIIVQSGTTITNTEIAIPIGDYTSTGSASYTTITDATRFYFDSSKYDGTLTAYFQATLRWYTDSATVYAQLYNVTDSEAVTGSAVSTTSGSYVLIRSGAITVGSDAGELKSGKEYVVQIRRRGAYSPTGSLASAQVVLVQSRTGGITKTRIYHPELSFTKTDADSTYTAQGFDNQFDPTTNEWQNVTNTYYFEATMKTSAGTGYAKLKDEDTPADITNAEITTTSTSMTRRTSSALSSMPASAKKLDTELKNNATNTTTVEHSWLIIDSVIGNGSFDALGTVSSATSINAVLSRIPGTPNIGASGNGDLWIFYQNGSDGDLYYIRGTIAAGYKWTWGTPTVQLAGDFDSERYLDLASAWETTNNRALFAWTNKSGATTTTRMAYVGYSGATPSITDISPTSTDYGKQLTIATGTFSNTLSYYLFYRTSSWYIALRSTPASSVSWSTETILDQSDSSLSWPALKIDDEPSATPKLDVLYLQGNYANNLYFHTWHMNQTYSRDGSQTILPTTSADRVVFLDEAGYTNTGTNDTSRENQAAANANSYPIFVFKYYNSNRTNSDTMAVSWIGQVDVTNTVLYPTKIQVWNNGTSAWVDIASNTSTAANTDFTLQTSSDLDNSNYYDSNYFSYFRVFATPDGSTTKTLKSNVFSISYTAVPENVLFLVIFAAFLPFLSKRIRKIFQKKAILIFLLVLTLEANYFAFFMPSADAMPWVFKLKDANAMELGPLDKKATPSAESSTSAQTEEVPALLKEKQTLDISSLSAELEQKEPQGPTLTQSKIKTPKGEKVKFQDKEIKFSFTDDNKNENLLIVSDQKTYIGLVSAQVYFSVTNTNKEDELVNLLVHLPENKGEVVSIENWNEDKQWKTLETSVNEKIEKSNLPVQVAQKVKSTPQNLKPKTETKHLVKANQTSYFKMEIKFPPMSSGEFYIEALGDKKGYGQLDPWWNSSWQNRKKITIDYTKVSATLSNFPVLINLSSDADLAADAQDDGDDIAFTDNAATPAQLKHEIEKFDGTTGELVAWVKIASLSSTADTVIYMYYDNPAATSQQDATNVWDTNYKMVYHLKDATTSTTNDSTASPNNGTKTAANEPIETVNGKFARAQKFDGSNDKIALGTTKVPTANSQYTIEAWIKPKAYGTYGIMGWGNYTTNQANAFRLTSTGLINYWYSNDLSATISNLDNGNWHHVIAKFDGTTRSIRVDGTQIGSDTPTGHNMAAANVTIGTTNTSEYFPGYIDEVRISDTGRSADWLNTEYNNISSPSSFYTIGTEQAVWWNSSWSSRKQITIDYTKVSATLTDFPVLINLSSDADLAADAQDDGDDIAFTDNGTTPTQLKHEIEKFDGTTGELVAWVKISSLSSTANTIIYMYYGNASATSQQDATNVWDTNFKLVQHLKNATTTTTSDSTSNGFTGTKLSSTEPTETTGKMGKGEQFDGSNDYITLGDQTALELTTITMEGWVYREGDSTPFNSGTIFSKGESGNTGYSLRVEVSGGTYKPTLSIRDNLQIVAGTTTINTGTWYHIVGTFDGTTVRIYVNGTQEANPSQTQTPTFGGESAKIGNRNSNNDLVINGVLDEVRVSNTVRSADWITAEYNNQSSPNSFYALGSEESDAWWNTSWKNRRLITIDHTKVPSDQSNFPVLINLSSDADLAADAQDDADDIAFTNSSGTQLKHEIEKFDGTTGQLVAWVKIPTLSSTADTKIYMYYNYPSATSQQDPTNVWDTNFKMVQHLKDLTTSTTDDSTSNGYDGTKYAANQPIEATGRIGKGQDCDGTDDYIQTTSTSGGTRTLEAWIKPDTSDDVANIESVIDSDVSAAYGTGWGLDAGFIKVLLDDQFWTTDKKVALSQWQHIVLTLNSTTAKIYYNGQLYATLTYTQATAGTAQYKICKSNANALYFDGIVDEVRVSDSVRSADWIQTEYNNQLVTTNFFALDSEERTQFFTQKDYRWYANADSVQPGSALAAEDTSYTLTSVSSPVRLRTNMGVTVNNLAATSQSLKLQYATSTSGPWSDAANSTSWFNNGWSYRKPVTVDNTNNSNALTAYQVLVTADTTALISSSKIQSDCDDLRFTDSNGADLLDYWIESGCNTATTRIWVKVPSISASSSKTIYMYYGNSTISAGSSVSNTFINNSIFYSTGGCTYCNPASHIETDVIREYDAPTSNSYVTTIDDSSGGANDNKRFRFLFVPSSTASYSISTNSDDGSDVGTFPLDGYGGGLNTTHPYGPHDIVSYWYGGHGSGTCGTSATYTSARSLTASQGYWFDYVMANGGNPQYANMCINDGSWKTVNTTNFANKLFARKYPASGLEPATVVGTTEEGRVWKGYNNTTPTDGATITSTVLSSSDVNESYEEFNNTASNLTTISIGQEGEWDFALDPANTTTGQTYYFRMVESNGGTFNFYDYYPTLTAPSASTFTQKDYRWYANADGVQPGSALAAEDTSYKLTSHSTPIRLRTNVTVGGSDLTALSTSWWNTNWASRKQITIDKTKVPSTQSNFPVLINLAADSDLAADALDSGNDIAFTDSSGTQLKHEIEKFDGTTGELIAWVKITSLSSTADTTIYMYYGNSSATNQQDATNVWDANYKGVQHLKDATTSTTSDSTNTVTGTKYAANEPIEATGKIGKGQTFDGSNDYINITNSNYYFNANLTIEMWIKPPNVTGNKTLTTSGYDGGGPYWHAAMVGSDIYTYFGTGYNTVTAGITADQWQHIVFTVTSGTTNAGTLYVNGVSKGNFNRGTGSSTGVHMGRHNGSYTYSGWFNGGMDEFRISNTNRSADWITAEYNNQSSPGTFYSVGNEESSQAFKLQWATSTGGTWTDAMDSTWYNTGWSYRKPITVDNSSNANTLSNYQVLVNTDTQTLIDAGKMQANCNDIRFTDNDGTTLLNHWLETNCALNTQDTFSDDVDPFWTQDKGNSTTATYTETGGNIEIFHPGTTNTGGAQRNNDVLLRHPINTTSDFTFTAKQVSYTTPANRWSNGLMLYKDRDNFIQIGHMKDVGSEYIHVSEWVSGTNYTRGSDVAWPGLPMYFRIRKVSSTYYFDYSTDGSNWTNQYNTSSLSYTPTDFGLVVDQWYSNLSYTTKFDYVTWTPSENSKIWVKVPTITASQSKTIYMYYGNSTATSTSSITNTFTSNTIWHGTGSCSAAYCASSMDNHTDADSVRSDVSITSSGTTTALDDGTGGDNFIRRYRFLFVPSSTASYQFATNSDDGSEVSFPFYDSYGGGINTAHPYGAHYTVANWYGPHGSGTCGTSGSTGKRNLVANSGYWIDYVMDEGGGGQLAQMCINDGSWKTVNTTNFSGKLFSRLYPASGAEPTITPGSETSMVWKGYNNTTPSDGATITSALLTTSDVKESYEEFNNTASNLTTISAGQEGEWDFALDPVNSVAGQTYYFRMVKADGTVFSTYTNYPTLAQTTTYYLHNNAVSGPSPAGKDITETIGSSATANSLTLSASTTDLYWWSPSYPTGGNDATIEAGNYFTHLHGSVSGTVAYYVEIGYADASGGANYTQIAQSAQQTWSGTEMNFDIGTGSTLTFTSGTPKRLRLQLHYVSGGGTLTLNYDQSNAGSNSYIGTPVVTVPEKVLILLFLIPFLPRILRRVRSRRKDETVIQALGFELKDIKKDILNWFISRERKLRSSDRR